MLDSSIRNSHYARACIAYEQAAVWNLSTAQCAVLQCIAHHDMGNGAWPSLETMHNETKAGRSTVCDSLRWFETLGLIRRDGRVKRHVKWRLAPIFWEQKPDVRSGRWTL